MADWSAQQYLKFEDERTRPARDLLAQIPLLDARKVVDIGCGPGNSTELSGQSLAASVGHRCRYVGRYAAAGAGTSAAQTFIEANIAHWVAPAGSDVLFANAVFQWVPDHIKQLKRLVGALPQGGVLAVQMPDNLDEPSHILMREVAYLEPWRAQLSKAGGAA